METFFSVIVPIMLIATGYSVGSTKVVNQGNEALVERLGRYRKKLEPGLNFIVPFLDSIVVEETVRERLLDIPPQSAITQDKVEVKADALVYWQILDLAKAYYAVENLEEAIEELVTPALRSEIGQLELDETYSSRDRINRKLSEVLDEATSSWGVKVTRVEVREMTPSQDVLDSIETERIAQSKKRAEIAEAEAKVESIKIISSAIQNQPDSQQVLKYLIAQQYVDANERLSGSANSKIVFMDPAKLTEATTDLMGGGEVTQDQLKNHEKHHKEV
ncbi:MAG: stomatin-like protein [Spirulinaceae cyanobacterium]